ncbi:hypothetical protein YA0871_04250 [Pseudomonas paralactis]|uniref:Uncharacterized protein n=1 Tax=Pseudomonas paralactis TaxID=1615673 RepID=A0ABS0UV09_9PSED|nr:MULTISPECIES: hypothetical protein [Pseudomonas]MBI6631861.1 hypothetical protein [Pseudomonas paralactis]MBJ2217432.1 hypothetical protein [Pseudomonas sp. MF7453]
MAAGFQAFNAQGEVLVDVNTRLARVIGRISSGTGSGSLMVDAFAQGRPWYMVTLEAGINVTDGPQCRISQNTLMWSASVNPGLITYGIS